MPLSGTDGGSRGLLFPIHAASDAGSDETAPEFDDLDRLVRG